MVVNHLTDGTLGYVVQIALSNLATVKRLLPFWGSARHLAMKDVVTLLYLCSHFRVSMRLESGVHPKSGFIWILGLWTVAKFNHPELYILRHGETVWNPQAGYQGRKVLPLTEKCRQQAVRQRKLLNAIETLPRKVFVSPLGRTVETA